MNDKQLASLTREQARRLVPEFMFREMVRIETDRGPGFMASNRAINWLMEGDNCVILDKAGWGKPDVATSEEENRAVGLRPMTITPQAADELRALLADDTPGHEGTPVPTRDAPPADPGEEDR